MTIMLRDVTAEDEPFLREVYACTRAFELSLVPWSDEQREAFLKFQFDAQDAYYHEQHPNAAYQVILKDNNPVGRLYVARSTELRILDITVLPQYRNAGIGTVLLEDLLAEAADAGKSVSIWVEHFNPSQTLFGRLGFSKVAEDGLNHLLEWRLRTSASEV